MTGYRYVFGTLLNEKIVEEIPLYGVYISMEMNNGGQLQGTFQLDQTGKDNASLIAGTIPGRSWVACERNGVCIWHGFVWSRVYSAQSKSVQLFCMSFDNYAKKRLIDRDLTYDSVERLNIFTDLWNQMQSDTNSNMNINIPTTIYTTVFPKDLTILATDYRYYDEVMSELSDGINGFDWYIGVAKDGAFYRKTLLIGYPTLGSLPNSSMTVFEYPGNITQYYMTESMIDAGTNITVIGGGEASETIAGKFDNTDMYSQGWPRWDTDISRKDITDQGTINAFASQLALVRKPPMNVIKLTVKGNIPPVEFGTYNLGDTCQIIIKDARNPDSGFSGAKRLLKWELTPESSDNTEEATLTFEGDPDV